jgi:hypothetical protein
MRQIRLAYKKLVDRAEARIEREALANAYHVLTTESRRDGYDRKLRLSRGWPTRRRRSRRPGWPPDRFGGLGIADRGALAVRRLRTPAVEPESGAGCRHPLLAMMLLMLPFYGPLVQKLPMIGEPDFDTQRQIIVIGGTDINPGGELPVMWITLGVIFAITTVLGFAWKWHAWVICWAVFYGIAITLFTGFFTNRGGVWSGIWGSLDYTWRPESRHADGPVYYYGMMLPAYEFLPLLAVALGGVALLLIGGWRNRITMIAAGAAIALLTIAPEWRRCSMSIAC